MYFSALPIEKYIYFIVLYSAYYMILYYVYFTFCIFLHSFFCSALLFAHCIWREQPPATVTSGDVVVLGLYAPTLRVYACMRLNGSPPRLVEEGALLRAQELHVSLTIYIYKYNTYI